MPGTAVVILNYNGRDFLLRFLPTLIQNTTNAGIIVADNRSTDDSMEVLKTFKEIRTIALPENYGYANGYNEALKQIDADYYVLVNSDIEVTLNWLEPLISALNVDNQLAAVQPKILDFNNRDYFEYAGAAGGFIDLLGYPYCRGRIFDHLEMDNGQYDDPIDIFWASGACFAIRANTFHHLNGFDPDFFAHMEEIDLCWRIHSLGLKVSCNPASVVFHVGGGTLNKSNARKTYLNIRNGISLLIKNLPISYLIFILPIRVFLDIIAGIKFWTDNRQISHFLAVLRAHVDSVKDLSKNLKKRKQISVINKPVNLLWAFFGRGKKTYSEISNTR